MPRNGDGSSDNGPFEEAEHNIVHGAGKPDVSLPPYFILHYENYMKLTITSTPD
jgi:hypothetical protein